MSGHSKAALRLYKCTAVPVVPVARRSSPWAESKPLRSVQNV